MGDGIIEAELGGAVHVEFSSEQEEILRDFRKKGLVTVRGKN